jgi:mannose-6-phosphate isomerase-like protein (cupin superfamily)
MKKINLLHHLADRTIGPDKYQEILRSESMSAGIYVLTAGSRDPQYPHAEDELYYIISGEAMFSADEDRQAIQPGDVLYVPAGMPHYFFDIEQDLVILVVFAPPESD